MLRVRLTTFPPSGAACCARLPTRRPQKCAQVLLTLDNLANRSQYICAKNTFEELLRWVPRRGAVLPSYLGCSPLCLSSHLERSAPAGDAITGPGQAKACRPPLTQPCVRPLPCAG